MLIDSAEDITLPFNTPFSNALTCQKCGCHHHSVRQVIYPYVISLFVITFRREFHGRWCWKHRTLYLLLAAVITGTVGWLGFPFGLIYTPITLFRLAKGTVMHKASNLKLLRSLAEAHQQRGLLEGARRCMEDSLQFVDDLWGRQQLEHYYGLPQIEENPRSGLLRISLSPAWLVAASVLLSGLTGLITHYVDKVVDLPAGSEFNILAPLVLWMPFAAICLGLIFILRQVQEKILENHPYQNPILLLGMALLAGILAAYGFLEGRAIGVFFDILQRQPVFPSGSALLNLLGAVLSRGGLVEIPHELRSIDLWNSLHHILLTGVPLIFPAVLVFAAWPYLAWERLLKEIHERVPGGFEISYAPRLGRLAPFIGFACLTGLLFVFPQQSLVDFIEARDHLYAGNVWADQEDYDQAILEYKTAVQLDSFYAPAYIELGWSYYQQDDNQSAIAQYTRGLELSPDRADAHYDLGRIYYNDDQPENAALEFEKTLQLDPGNYHAYLGIGWVAYDQGDLEKAETNFHKALEYNSKVYDAYIGLGYIYQDRDQVDQEISAYQKAVESDSSSAEAHTLLGMAYYDKNELDLAVTSLEKGVSLEPDDKLARLYLTQAYIYTGQPDTAVTFSRETLKTFPEWAGAHALLALSLIETRQVDMAIAETVAAQGIAEKTDSDRRLIIRAFFNANQPKEAELEAQAAIKDGQHPANFYLYLSQAYADLEDYSGALAVCDQAAKAGTRPADILLQQARIHLDQDQPDRSLEELRQVLQTEPKSSGAHYLLSLIYSDQDDDARALDEVQQAVALDRYDYSAYLHLSITQLSLGNTQDAISAGSRAALLGPYWDVPHYFLGIAYLQAGIDRSAAIELKKFLDLYEDSPSKQEMKTDAEKQLKRLNPSM